MKMNLEIFAQIQDLEHKIFMNNCEILKKSLRGQNTENLEKEIIQQEVNLQKLRLKLFKE